MARVVSLYLPSWSTDRARRASGNAAPSADEPFALIGRLGRRRVVLAADALALRSGARIGMAVAQATALIPGLVLRGADPSGDAEALERLALWTLRRYAPIANADPPDGLVIDTTGADHLHGGEAALLHDLVTRLGAGSIAARAAVADSWGAAHAAARWLAQPTAVVPPGESLEVLASLPVAALRLSAEIVDGLRVLGLERIGDLAARPRAPLALRFGPEIGRRLDQAFGRLAEPIRPVRPPELVSATRAFAEPIGAAETIARYIGKLVLRVRADLETRGLGARRLDLLCFRVDAGVAAIRVGTSAPTRDARHLTRLLCDRIETLDPGFGIERMTLTVSLAEPMSARQSVSTLVAEPVPDVSDLIDTLANRLGAGLLYRFAPVPSDVPERAVARVGPLAPRDGADWSDSWPRPARLLRAPEPIETVALLPDHPPETFTWRGIRRRVRRADGPERIFGEWWARDAEMAAVRDYFQVEDEAGERFWIYRAGDGEDVATGSQRWFLHGIFA
jgi:protein ImuB